jgi:RNA polymerase sigma-70 factor (ECF subfamily)
MVFDQKAYELKNIELCERYKAGDEDAFVELYKTNLPIFISRLRKKTVSLHDAQDIVQILFAKIYKNIKSISDSKMVNHWMAKSLKNEYISFVRHCNTKIQSNKLSLEDQEERVIRIAVDHNDPCKILEGKEPNNVKLSIIKEAISLLKDRERKILELTLQDKEYKEIAKELNIPHGTVMSRVFYARKALRRKCKRLIDSRQITL